MIIFKKIFSSLEIVFSWLLINSKWINATVFCPSYRLCVCLIVCGSVRLSVCHCLCVCLSICLTKFMNFAFFWDLLLTVLHFLSWFIIVCLTVCWSICLSVCLSLCLSVCRSVFLTVCLLRYLSVCLSVRLSEFMNFAWKKKYTVADTPNCAFPVFVL